MLVGTGPKTVIALVQTQLRHLQALSILVLRQDDAINFINSVAVGAHEAMNSEIKYAPTSLVVLRVARVLPISLILHRKQLHFRNKWQVSPKFKIAT